MSAGTATGLLNVVSKQADHFTPQRVALLTALGSGLGPFLENARGSQELQDRAEEAAAIAAVGGIITSSLHVGDVYERFASEVKTLVDFDSISICVVDRDADTYTTKYHFGTTPPGVSVGATARLSGTQTEQVALTALTLSHEDVSADPRFNASRSYLAIGLRSSLMAPLSSKGRVLGTLGLRSRRAETYNSRDREIIERLANQIAPTLENSLLFQEREWFALALEHVGEALALMDNSGNIQFVNGAFSDLYGYRREEVLGNQPSSFLPIRNQIGEVIGSMGITCDITAHQQAEQGIEESSRMASMGQPATGMAHKINNPLAVVLSLSQLIIAEDLPEQVTSDIRNLYGEAQKAATIVQNILSFTRKREPVKQFTQLTQTLEKVIQFKAADLRTNNNRGPVRLAGRYAGYHGG